MRVLAARRTMWLGAMLVAAGAIGSCADSAGAPSPSGSPATVEPTGADPRPSLGSTQAIGGGEPRTSAYWIAWSTCGDNSQADVARQNGGRQAGWILVDDLLVDPGLALGNHDVTGCEEAVAVLAGRTGGFFVGALDALARQVLTTELNLSSGSETCEAAENAVVLGQGILTAVGFDGRSPARRLSADEDELASDVVTALSEYNAGVLCR